MPYPGLFMNLPSRSWKNPMVRGRELTGEEKGLNTEGTEKASTGSTEAQPIVLLSSEISLSVLLLCDLRVESFRPVPKL